MELTTAQRSMFLRFCAYGFLKNLQFFEPFLYLFLLAKGLSYTQIGALIGVRAISVYLLEVPTGIIADVTGRRRAMVIAFGSYIASFAIFSLTGSFWLFVPAMVLFGAGEAFRSGTHKAMIMQHLDAEGLSGVKVHYYGRTRSASRLGSAVSVLIAAGLVYLTGTYRFVFLATIVPYLLGMILMLTYPAELDGEVTGRASLGSMLRHTVESLRAIRRTPELKKILLNSATFEAHFKVAKDYLQPILGAAAFSLPVLYAVGAKKGGEAAVLIGPVYFAIHLNAFFSSRYSGHLADRTGHLGRALNGLFWAFAVAFYLVGVFQRHNLTPMAVLMMFLFYTLLNLRKPMVVGFLSEKIKGQQRATVLSVHSQMVAITQAAVAVGFGVIADHLGIPFVFLIGGLVLLAAGAVLRLDSRGPAVESEEAPRPALEGMSEEV